MTAAALVRPRVFLPHVFRVTPHDVALDPPAVFLDPLLFPPGQNHPLRFMIRAALAALGHLPLFRRSLLLSLARIHLALVALSLRGAMLLALTEIEPTFVALPFGPAKGHVH